MIWVCGNRTPKSIRENKAYTFFDPFVEINEKKNINHLNRFWSEYVCQYYVFMNKIKSDIVTFCHDTRIVKPQCIDAEKILDEGSIQYYCVWGDDFTKETDKLGNPIDQNKLYRNIYHDIVNKTNQPMFMYEDFIEYLESQKILALSLIKEYAKLDIQNFPNREMYSCSWKTFVEMQTFLHGYVEFVEKKHDLKGDVRRYKEMFKELVIPHYQKSIRDVDEDVSQLTFSNKLYQSDERFTLTMSESTEYGFDSCNNVWRIFSYQIEYLIGMFISCRPHFTVENQSSAIIYV